METDNPRILIIDDEKDTLKLLKILFEKEGYEVFTEQNGLNVIQRIDEVSPDLIVLDILMPEFSGLEVIKLIKRRYNDNLFVPVVALTSHHDLGMKLDVLKEGAIDYITKPFQKYELFYRIRNIFNHCIKRKTNKEIKPHKVSKLFFDGQIILSPHIDKDSPYGYSYPNAREILTPDDEVDIFEYLQKLVETGNLKQIFYDVISLCPNCSHYNISSREICPHCSVVLENTGRLKCNKCKSSFTTPDIQYACFNCGTRFQTSEIIIKKIYEYKLNSEKKVTSVAHEQTLHAEERMLLQAFQETHLPYTDKTLIKYRIKECISTASQEHYNVTLVAIELTNFSSIIDTFGQQPSLKLIQSMLFIIHKLLRQSDVVSYNINDKSNILLLLPHTHINMAKIITRRIKSAFEKLNQEIDVKIKLASYPEDGYNENEVLAMLDMGIEVFEEEFFS